MGVAGGIVGAEEVVATGVLIAGLGALGTVDFGGVVAVAAEVVAIVAVVAAIVLEAAASVVVVVASVVVEVVALVMGATAVAANVFSIVVGAGG